MHNKIQFQDNRLSTAKIKNQKKKLSDAKLQEVTKNTSRKTKFKSIEAFSGEWSVYLVNNDTNKEKWFLSGETSLLGCNTNQI